MKRIQVSRLSNEALLQELEESVAQDCPHTARQVALIGEIERRRLYAPAGYPSMYRYCVGHLHLSEAAAYKRIWVARLARKHPVVLAALAEGRVHLAGLHVMAKRLKDLEPAVVDELLTAATHRTRWEIEKLMAERFPKPDVKAEVRAIPAAPARALTLTSASTEDCANQPQPIANTESQLSPGKVGGPVILGHVAPPRPDYTRVAPLAPQRY